MLRFIACIAFQLALTLTASAQTPALQTLLNDIEVGDHWIYDDYAKAVAQAKETGKPLLVLFR